MRIILLFVLIHSFSVLSLGDREGNGGNPTLIAIAELNRYLLEQIISLEDDYSIFFKGVSNNIILSCREPLWLNGNQVVAINYPLRQPQELVFDCKEWKRLSLLEKVKLLIHELSFLAGLNDFDYYYTLRFWDLLSNKYEPDRSLATRKVISCDYNYFSANIQNWFPILRNPEDLLGQSILEKAFIYECLPLMILFLENGFNLNSNRLFGYDPKWLLENYLKLNPNFKIKINRFLLNLRPDEDRDSSCNAPSMGLYKSLKVSMGC